MLPSRRVLAKFYYCTTKSKLPSKSLITVNTPNNCLSSSSSHSSSSYSFVLIYLAVFIATFNCWPASPSSSSWFVAAVRFGDSCQRLSDCFDDSSFKSAAGVICRWASSSCARGICTCDDDFVEDNDNRLCRKVVKLGDTCRLNAGDTCGAENAICYNDICRCSIGFKPGPRGDDCIPASMVPLSYGDSCYYRVALFHDAYCPYNMVCTPTGCACPPGFTVNRTTNFDCIPILLGEQCSTDVDCSQNVNAVCVRERNYTCGCRPGFRVIRYRYGSEWKQRCVKRDARLLIEGDYCGDAYPFNTPLIAATGICSEPYSCVACAGSHSPSRICGIVDDDAANADGATSVTPRITASSISNVKNFTKNKYEKSPSTNALVKYDRRQRMLGERCDNMFRAECALPHSDCINGICQCIPGTGCVFKDYETSGGVFDVRRTGVFVGTHCSSDADCSTDGSMVCQPVSASCSTMRTNYRRQYRGVCACASPNYAERVYHMHDTGLKRDTVSTCSRRLRLGEVCSKSRTGGKGVCSARNSDCVFGVCQCLTGFKVAPWGDECIPEEQNRYYGEKCLFSEECYWGQSFEFPMACLDNTCGCLAGTRPGMKNPDGPAYGCVANRLGDRCMSDMDCHLYWRYNWHCSTLTQQCECNPGYYAAKLALRDGNSIAQWCVPYNATLRVEGEACKQSVQEVDVQSICASPLVCSSCEDVYSNDGICGKAPPADVKINPGAMVRSWTKSRDDGSICLATPIDNDIQLLMAPAHCFPEPSATDTLTVEIYLRSSDGRNVSVNADSLLRHPSADISLIKYKVADKNSALPPAMDLPSPAFCDELYNCTTAYFPLWLRDLDNYNNAFESKSVEIIPTNQCLKEYGRRVDIPVSQKTLCAGRYQPSPSGACERQSSYGPLTCRNPNGRLVVAGLPLRLSSCAVVGMPRVFTRVCFSLDWIAQARTILSTLQLLGTNLPQAPSSSSSSPSIGLGCMGALGNSTSNNINNR